MPRNIISKELANLVAHDLYYVQTGRKAREDAEDEILSHVASHYVCVDMLQTVNDVPLTLLDTLARLFGVSFIIQDGEIRQIWIDLKDK